MFKNQIQRLLGSEGPREMMWSVTHFQVRSHGQCELRNLLSTSPSWLLLTYRMTISEERKQHWKGFPSGIWKWEPVPFNFSFFSEIVIFFISNINSNVSYDVASVSLSLHDSLDIMAWHSTEWSSVTTLVSETIFFFFMKNKPFSRSSCHHNLHNTLRIFPKAQQALFS